MATKTFCDRCGDEIDGREQYRQFTDGRYRVEVCSIFDLCDQCCCEIVSSRQVYVPDYVEFKLDADLARMKWKLLPPRDKPEAA
jgi:hypothetical protein